MSTETKSAEARYIAEQELFNHANENTRKWAFAFHRKVITVMESFEGVGCPAMAAACRRIVSGWGREWPLVSSEPYSGFEYLLDPRQAEFFFLEFLVQSGRQAEKDILKVTGFPHTWWSRKL
jgi:hypothetical protein